MAWYNPKDVWDHATGAASDQMDSITGVWNDITGKTQSEAYEDAARTQSDATKYAADLAHSQFLQNKELIQPWVDAGSGSLNSLSAALKPGGTLYDTDFSAKDFEIFKDPSYDWRVEQGGNALAAHAAAVGNYGSGNMATDLVDYGQNAASQEYANAYGRYMNSQNTLFDRLYNMSSLGANAASGVANMGSETAATMGDYATQGANALATGAVNSATAGANATNGLLNQAMMFALLA